MDNQKEGLNKMANLIKKNAGRISRMSITDHLALKNFSEKINKPNLLNFGKKKKDFKIQDGKTKLQLSTGTFYEGEVKNSRLKGEGNFQFKDSKIGKLNYKGNFTKNKANGYGILELEKKTYKGNFKDNKIEGLGQLETDFILYNGQWLSNKINGYGRMLKKKFSLYEGHFLKNERDGLGIEIYENSDIYIGEFKNDLKNGLGIYFFQKGGFFYGFFKDNLREGYGVLYNKSYKLNYRGFWSNDLKNGIGYENYKNGSNYDGFFKNGKRHGIGFMIYNQTLEYLGEWEDGEKNGMGKLDVKKKTLIGKFLEGRMIEMKNINPSVFLNKLNAVKNFKSVEDYLNKNNYKIKRVNLKYSTEIYKIIKVPIPEFVFELVKTGVLRLRSYVILKNLFERLSFEDILKEISVSLKFEPNLKYLESFWQTNLAEICRDKKSYHWDIWILEQQVKEEIFDSKLDEELDLENKSQNEDLLMEIIKTGEKIALKLSNLLAIGYSTKHIYEGVLDNFGFHLNVFDKETMFEEESLKGKIFPFFLTLDSKEEKKLLTIKLIKYTGEFYFFKDQENPRKICIFFGFDQMNNIYSVGIDRVGTYVVVGEWNKKEKKGVFIQKYFLNYEIQYEAFFFNFKKIQGYWKTTNLNGYFLLRKDESFDFNTAVSATMHNVLECKKDGVKYEIKKDKYLKTVLDSSILAVVVKGKQGGIPDLTKKIENDEDDKNLFAKYKKHNQEDDQSNSVNKKIKDSKKRKISVNSIDSSQELDQISDSKVQQVLAKNLVSRLNRKSFQELNSNIIKKQKFEEGEESQKLRPKSKTFFIPTNDLTEKLSTALKRLKTITKKKDKQQKNNAIITENFNWQGLINTLGKEESIVINNLVINGDFVEGTYNSDNIIYELAGSCSLRTKEIEIIGLSTDKKKTVKIKGFLKGFKIIGNFLKRPSKVPDSTISLELKGYKCKSNFKIKKTLIQNAESMIKVTEHFIYGIVIFDKEYLFILGNRRDKDIFFIDIVCSVKGIRKHSLFQDLKNNVSGTSATSRIQENLFFKDDDNNFFNIVF